LSLFTKKKLYISIKHILLP